MTRPSLRSLVSLLFVALVALSACQARVDVAVDVEDDASGEVTVTVELDREAVDRLEGVGSLRTEDLTDAGWVVADTIERDDGAVVLSAAKSFADPAELGRVLEEISGPGGPYGRLGLRVERPFARAEYQFEGVLDGTVGVDAFADPGLAAALDGLPFGTDLAELEAELGAPIGSLVALGLNVDLPGDQVGDAGAAVENGSLRWTTTLDALDPVPVLANSETLRVQTLALAGAAALLALLFVILVIVRVLVGIRRRRRRRRAERSAAATPRPIADAEDHGAPDAAPAVVDAEEPVARAAPEGDTDRDESGAPDPAAAPAVAAAGERPSLELVVIGGPGTMFGVRDVVDDVVAFARVHGSLMEYPRIADQYQQAAIGRLSTSEMWMAVGAEGDPRRLDEEFLGQYALAPGLREFVARARDRGFGVAYLGDGPTAWTDRLRQSFVLGDLIEWWIVSGSVGVSLPETAIFEALRRTTGVEPGATLVIDDRLRVLEAARALGYGTAWSSPTGRAVEAPGHSIIRGFADLLSS
ncbi:MAG: HAD family hydrolase [Acidimicrobiales bacterium]